MQVITKFLNTNYKYLMSISFCKYHGAGNDFIIVDNRSNTIKINAEQISRLCHRHFGIGADGLMLLNSSVEFDFEMDYYNSDGSGSTMCGNGGRCIVAFASRLGIIGQTTRFLASDGQHEAELLSNGEVKLKMINATQPEKANKGFFVNTGSPHHVEFLHDIRNLDVYSAGRSIRYSSHYAKAGTNVNFVKEIALGKLDLRTYERGVENETLACGTGAVASALSYAHKNSNNRLEMVDIRVQGGQLKVYFRHTENGFEDIWLQGPAEFVFKGEIQI